MDTQGPVMGKWDILYGVDTAAPSKACTIAGNIPCNINNVTIIPLIRRSGIPMTAIDKANRSRQHTDRYDNMLNCLIGHREGRGTASAAVPSDVICDTSRHTLTPSFFDVFGVIGCGTLEMLVACQEDLPPEYSKVVDEHFWELV